MQKSLARELLNKVPEVTIFFWIIKVLCTTVGETAADFLNTTLGFGLTGTTLVMGALLIVVLVFQLIGRKYISGIYWFAVVLISVFGTLVTDNLSDKLGVPLWESTVAFSIILAAVFAVWFYVEKTLSMHSIVTTRRESFYWLAIFFTFALGTAAGDLMAESLNLGYFTSALIFAGLIAIITVAHYGFKALKGPESPYAASNAVLAFWLAYILTRPLGASIGDLLSQAPADGGLGLGTTITSIIFLVAILGTVIYLTITRKDATEVVMPKDLAV
jgi:uncharacterized membrane-anchored protein